MGKFENLEGIMFGRLTAIKPTHDANGRLKWICRCSCGNTVHVRTDCLKNGNTKSCGCLRSCIGKKTLTKHGNFSLEPRLYNIWSKMNGRCYDEKNKRYSDYGGRGIKVCDEWHEFKNFLEWSKNNGYKDNLTIDRIDNNGNYSPCNCRWATVKQQNNNKRNNTLLTYNGETKTISEWSIETGLKQACICKRIASGWNVEDVLTKKKNSQFNIIEFEGKSMNLRQWSKETGISSATISKRLSLGWSVKNALTIKPSIGRNQFSFTTKAE